MRNETFSNFYWCISLKHSSAEQSSTKQSSVVELFSLTASMSAKMACLPSTGSPSVAAANADPLYCHDKYERLYNVQYVDID